MNSIVGNNINELRSIKQRFEDAIDETLIQDIAARRWEEQELLGAGRFFEVRALSRDLVGKRLQDPDEDAARWKRWRADLQTLRELAGEVAGWPPYRFVDTGEEWILVMPRLTFGTAGVEAARLADTQATIEAALATRGFAVEDHWQWGQVAGQLLLLDLSDVVKA